MLNRLSMMLIVVSTTAFTTNAAELPPSQVAEGPAICFEDRAKTLAIVAKGQREVVMRLWFYEWHLFDAVVAGQHTINRTIFPWEVKQDGAEATIKPLGMTLNVKAVSDGAELTLYVKNQSEHDWPELASIIPCFNPGSIRGPTANTRFIDDRHEQTYYLGANGLTLLNDRRFHCRASVRGEFAARVSNGECEWPSDCPLSDVDATGGLMLREGNEGKWVTGIAWDRFLSCQGHNPWKCMHLAVQLGPLKRGDSRTVCGRIYLFRGTKERCLQKYLREFIEPATHATDS